MRQKNKGGAFEIAILRGFWQSEMREKSRNFKIGFKRFQRFQRFQRFPGFRRFPSGVGRSEEGRGGRNLEKSRPPTDPIPPFRKLMKLRKFTNRFRFRTFRTTLFLQRLAEILAIGNVV